MPYGERGQSRYTGWFKPLPARVSSPNLWEQATAIGFASKFYTQCRCYLKPPTFEFPTASLFLSFQNGNGGAFARLSSPLELIALAKLLTQWATELEALWAKAKGDEALMQEKMEEMEREFLTDPARVLAMMNNKPPISQPPTKEGA